MNFLFGNETESVPVWHEPYIQRSFSEPVRTTVKRNKKYLHAMSLPVVSVSNMRSILPKINNFKNDVKERGIHLCLLSEIWEKKGKKKHINEVHKMLEIDGLQYISTTRPSNKRGGGCAIVADLSKFTLEKITGIHVPRNLEVVYGLMRPKTLPSKFREIIAIAFYSPPKSKKKNDLLDHIISSCQSLLAKYPDAGLVIGGDRNEMSVSPILDSIPRTKQIVTKPTCNGKILDISITNMHDFYGLPVIATAVPADNTGVPSDHSTVIAAPHSSVIEQDSNEYKTKTTRPLPESGIRSFGQWIVQENWNLLNQGDDPTTQANLLDEIINAKLDKHFPVKTVKISHKDKPWINFELKKLDRLKKREWVKKGKSPKYLELKKKFDTKYKEALEKYLNKNVRELMAADPGKAYSTLKRLGAKPGDELDNASFDIIEHLESKLTNTESVEKIAEHFCKISQEYPSLSTTKLSEPVVKKLMNIKKANLPFISKYAVEKQIRKVKKSISGSNGDLPKCLVNEFSQELSEPLSIIYNNITASGHWPQSWKTEYGLALKKVTQPISEGDLMIISLSSIYSEIYEKFVMHWLLEYLHDKIDPHQYGGQKGNSVSL